MTTIITKNGTGVPSNSSLATGELAVDTTNKRIYTSSDGTNVSEVGTNPSTLTVDTNTLVVNAANNRVGVGTAAPRSVLDVINTGGEAAVLVDSRATDNEVSRLSLLTKTSGANTGGVLQHSGGVLSLSNATNLTTKHVNINSSGNVGIGTDSPNAPLTIESSTNDAYALRLGNSSGGSGSVQGVSKLGLDTGTSSPTHASALISVEEFDAGDFRANMHFATRQSNSDVAPTTAMTIDNSGNVGIGTDTPSNLLAVGEAPDAAGIKFSVAGNGFTTRLAHDTSGTARSHLYVAGSAELAFGTDSTERMRIDSSGNVGIGASSPTDAGLVVAQSVGGDYANFGNVAGRGYTINVGPAASGRSNCAANFNVGDSIGQYTWSTASTERMRIDNNGNLLVGKTVKQTQTAGVDIQQLTATDGDGALGLRAGSNSTTGNAFINCFLKNGTGSGKIEANGANALAFASFSDRALKENITDLPSQLVNVMSLRPVEFDYKDGSGHQIGFIAQEVETVWPDLVHGEEGSKTLAGLSKTDSRLVKAIQEQQAMIEELKAEVAAQRAELSTLKGA